MFKPMAIVVMLALGGALALAVTLMPVLCSFVLTGRIKERQLAHRVLQTSLHAAT
jgi:cobalt-zinc-cadmium resistance protein CzcA